MLTTCCIISWGSLNSPVFPAVIEKKKETNSLNVSIWTKKSCQGTSTQAPRFGVSKEPLLPLPLGSDDVPEVNKIWKSREVQLE